MDIEIEFFINIIKLDFKINSTSLVYNFIRMNFLLNS